MPPQPLPRTGRARLLQIAVGSGGIDGEPLTQGWLWGARRAQRHRGNGN